MKMRSIVVHVPQQIGPYELLDTIGHGSFSIVKIARHTEINQYFACKVVPRRRISDRLSRQRFEMEIRVNQQIHHPGIVELLDLFEDNTNFYLILEFCANGELFSYITERGKLTEDAAKPIIRQLLEVIKYYQSMNVSHRDLKPENLLIGQDGKIKIADFGLATFMNSDGTVNESCGSPCYASPECLSGSRYDGRATDMWSLGVIMFAMLTGNIPWSSTTQRALFEQIRHGDFEIPKTLSPECISMISGLMCVNSRERMTVDMAMSHPWIAKVPAQYDKTNTFYGAISLRMIDNFLNREVKIGNLNGFDKKLSLSLNSSLTTIVRILAIPIHRTIHVRSERLCNHSHCNSEVILTHRKSSKRLKRHQSTSNMPKYTLGSVHIINFPHTVRV